MVPSASTERIGGMDGCQLLPSPRKNANECFGQEAGDSHQVTSMKIGNSGNYCYSNVIFKALVVCAYTLRDLSTIFMPSYCEFVKGLIRRSSASVVHLWKHPLWLSLNRGWARPSRQHDTAEYLLFLAGSPLLQQSSLEVVWQSRHRQPQDDGRSVADSGQSVPLLLPSPGEGDRDSHLCTTVQSLIQQWQQQPEVHAMLTPAKILVLQACRFQYDAEGHVTKLRYDINPCRVINVPCFVDNTVECRHVKYQLNSVVLHLGEAPTTGHYQLMCYEGERIYLMDDDLPARRVSASTALSKSTDFYLFFYISC